MYLYSCIALISFLIFFQNSMTLLGFGRDHLREAAVAHQCNGGRRFSLRMKPHQPNGEVRGRQGASTVTGMVQDDESCRCTCRASFFSTSAPVSSSHRIARNPSFRARTAGLRRTRRLTLIMATPTGFQLSITMDGNVRASGEVRWRLTISSRMISDLGHEWSKL